MKLNYVDAMKADESIEDKKAYSKTRLRSEFRLKPGPGAEPAFWFKNRYNRTECPCYYVSDCVPLRIQNISPPSPRQIIGRKISGLRSKLRSKAMIAGKAASELLNDDNVVILDSETTGLGFDAEIIELSIISTAGNILFDKRFKPIGKIESGAQAIHGITADMLSDAPAWTEHEKAIIQLLKDKEVIIFNSDFDLRLLQQTSSVHDLDGRWVEELNSYCAMYLAAQHFGSTNRYGTISLADSVYCADVEWTGAAHSAVADCLATLDVLHVMASAYNKLQSELKNVESELKRISSTGDDQ